MWRDITPHSLLWSLVSQTVDYGKSPEASAQCLSLSVPASLPSCLGETVGMGSLFIISCIERPTSGLLVGAGLRIKTSTRGRGATGGQRGPWGARTRTGGREGPGQGQEAMRGQYKTWRQPVPWDTELPRNKWWQTERHLTLNACQKGPLGHYTSTINNADIPLNTYNYYIQILHRQLDIYRKSKVQPIFLPNHMSSWIISCIKCSHHDKA